MKKLSKMNTLLLARNYILLLTRTLDELRRLLVTTTVPAELAAAAAAGGAGGGGAVASLRRHSDVHDALRSFVVRDLHAEHQRYVTANSHRPTHRAARRRSGCVTSGGVTESTTNCGLRESKHIPNNCNVGPRLIILPLVYR